MAKPKAPSSTSLVPYLKEVLTLGIAAWLPLAEDDAGALFEAGMSDQDMTEKAVKWLAQPVPDEHEAQDIMEALLADMGDDLSEFIGMGSFIQGKQWVNTCSRLLEESKLRNPQVELG